MNNQEEKEIKDPDLMILKLQEEISTLKEKIERIKSIADKVNKGHDNSAIMLIKKELKEKIAKVTLAYDKTRRRVYLKELNEVTK